MKSRILAWLLQYVCEPAFLFTAGIFFFLSLLFLVLRRKSIRFVRLAEMAFWYFLSQLLLVLLSLLARKVFLPFPIMKSEYPYRFIFLCCVVGILTVFGLFRLRGRPAAKVAPDQVIQKEDREDLQPFPEQLGVFLYRRDFTPEEQQRLCRGFLPRKADDAWFVCVDGNTLSFYNALGFYLYRLTLYPDGNHVVTVNKDPAQRTGANSNDAHRALLDEVIERLFLTDASR